MNKRIKELAEQATTKISFRLDPNTYKHIDDPDGDLERFEFDKEKFAELLIKETTNVIIKGHKGHMNPAMAYDSVKQHFGVEE